MNNIRNRRKKSRKNSRKNRINSYWKFLGIYASVWIVVMAVALLWVYGLLKDYEKGMPDSAMTEVLNQFRSENITNLVTSNAGMISEYEKTENVVAYITDKVNAGELSFSRKSGEYTSDTPVYIVKAGETSVAKVTLAATGKNGHGFTEWGVGNIEFGQFINNSNDITLTAPSGAVVKINGRTAEDDIIVTKDQVVELAKNVGDYVKVPTNDVYKVTGLMAEPEISVALNGQELAVTRDEKTAEYIAAYPADDELMASQSDRIKNINKEYGKYIINKGSLTKLKSYMIGNARKYVSDIPAVWAYLYGKQYTYEFKSNEISNFAKYSDDCFSCDIHFDLYVKWNTGDKNYDTNMTYVFVKQNNIWMLADFAIK